MIGIFDSGLGGFSVLREILKVLPEQSYVYYADSANCPYGEKSKEFIIGRARAITQLLLDKGADIIVVACNTATAAAIKTLRAEWPEVPFVGMEPAVKPAALHTRSGVIGVLATAGTLKGGNYLDLREKYSDSVKVVEHVGRGFVELVEKGVFDGAEVERTVRAAVEPLLAEGADTIVLGCTHYPFLEPVIRCVAGPDVEIINPAPAVARQTAKVLADTAFIYASTVHQNPDCDAIGPSQASLGPSPSVRPGAARGFDCTVAVSDCGGIEVLSSGTAVPDETIRRLLNF